MYRHSASFSGSNIGPTHRPSSPNKASDESDSDISSRLEQKRLQLDEEIVQFRAVKDKEFQDFEKSLKRQRQKRKREHKAKKQSSNSTEAEYRPGALSLLAGGNKNGTHTDGNEVPAKRGHDKSQEGKAARHPSSSKPTLSLDRQNIKGETTPPRAGSPLPTERLSKQISRSPSNHSLAHTPPRSWLNKGLPPLPMKESHDSFAGVFTPSYLPLLESKTSKEALQSQATDPRIQRHNSFSHSQTSSDMLSPTSRSQRSQTAPVLPSTSLPSALRTASGTAVRKRKHVTFQLGDRVVVNPSSSYEEGLSPEPSVDSRYDKSGLSENMTNGELHVEKATDDEAELGLPSPWWQKQICSPTIKGRERRPSPVTLTDPNLSARANLGQADDGGSGVGFFELDEEIASPGFGKVRPFEMDDADDVQEDDRANGSGKRGDYFEDEKGQTYEYGGSVPINIRPTGSWVGSFGH